MKTYSAKFKISTVILVLSLLFIGQTIMVWGWNGNGGDNGNDAGPGDAEGGGTPGMGGTAPAGAESEGGIGPTGPSGGTGDEGEGPDAGSVSQGAESEGPVGPTGPTSDSSQSESGLSGVVGAIAGVVGAVVGVVSDAINAVFGFAVDAISTVATAVQGVAEFAGQLGLSVIGVVADILGIPPTTVDIGVVPNAPEFSLTVPETEALTQQQMEAMIAEQGLLSSLSQPTAPVAQPSDVPLSPNGGGYQPTPVFALNVIKSGSAAGSGKVISQNVSGINCGNDCSENYSAGATVTLLASSSPEVVFAGWLGACSGTSTYCAVSMNNHKNVTAVFKLIQFALTITKSGPGVVISSNTAGINCGDDCFENYDAGTYVVLFVAPYSATSTFVGWSGSCSGSGEYCAVLMNEAKNVVATFN